MMTMLDRHLHHIGGAPRSPASGQFMPTLDPAEETPIADFARGDAADVDAAVRAADAAFRGDWAKITPQQRGRLLNKLADLVEARREDIALLETLDVGKPIGGSRGDVDGVIGALRYNAGAADKMEGTVVPLGPDYVDFTMLEPLGVTAHITPWNYPLGMAARSLAPALAAGCTAVLKPAEQSPLSTLLFAELAVEAGFPAGVVNVVTGTGAEAGVPLVAHPLVRGVTFTGSVATGRRVGVAAAERIIPCVLELGGKNAMIVWSDADLDRAVADALEGGFDNSGQVCSSSSRLLLHADIADAFLERLAERASRLRVGPGRDNPDLGPLVSDVQHAKVTTLVDAAKRAGARVLLGGGRPEGRDRGYFFAPTIVDRVPAGTSILSEEVFGPVMTATVVTGEDEAAAIANGVGYGLTAGIQTRDISRALRMARRLETGSVWINGWFMGGPQAPTGGTKLSGIGRERGLPGVRNYLQIKNVAIRL
jgi:acyl-CoA reductase-like NAD-dependent aldehyde dehydrogenase